MNLDKLEFKTEKREKTAFYCSDYGKPLLDLYFGFKGVEPTNPPYWYDSLKWGAGNGVEDAMLKVLKMNGLVKEDYDQKEHGRIEIKREGVQINGYIDAITVDGIPVEIKSVNNKNSFDIKKYEAGQPRENYVGQLCTYIDALDVDYGWLFVSTIDGLNRFLFKVTRDGNIFKYGDNLTLDLKTEKERWGGFYKKYIEGDEEPPLFEYFYKTPLEEIDWQQVPNYKIMQARSNKAVIGDYQITYSPWKDLIVQMQGEELGYTQKELDYIKEKTAGYSTSTWKKNYVKN